MTLTRRAFLAGAAGAAAAAALPVEALAAWPPAVDFTTDDLIVKAYEHYEYGWTDMRAVWGTVGEPWSALRYAEQCRCGLEGPTSPWPRLENSAELT